MKIIDLLVKIANGEEVPKRVRYKNDEWEFYKEFDDYLRVINGKNGTLFTHYILKDILNDEVEIIEDKPKKIGKMTVLGKDITLGSMENWIDNELNDNEQKICSAIDIIGIKTNEIIIALNYLLEKSDKE